MTRSQVTCLSLINDHLYVGTTYGRLVVIDPVSVSLQAICRPYHTSELSIILPLSQPLQPSSSPPPETSESASDPEVGVSPEPVLDLIDPALSPGSIGARPAAARTLFVTIGRGYVDLAGSTVAKYRLARTRDGSGSSDDILHRTALVVWSGDDWTCAKKYLASAAADRF